MADVYENGLFTIAATASEDSNGGLFSDQGSPFFPRKLSRSNLYVSQMPKKKWPEGYSARYFGQSPLLQRAWVFQERHVSSRVVHFTGTQIIWECNSMWKSESGHVNYDWTNEGCSPNGTGMYSPIKQPMSDAAQGWQKLVSAYSQLSITYVKDKLPALAAIVTRMMQSRPDDEYIAGMWKKTILQDMLWACDDVADPLPRPEIKVPTWSWASVSGQVWFAWPITLSATITNATYKHVGPAQLGSVTGASIVLRGRSHPAVLFRRTSSYEARIDIGSGEIPWPDLFKIHFCSDYDLRTATEKVSLVFIGYSRGEWLGLVLRQVSPEEYERIGRIELRIYPSIDCPSSHRARSSRFGYRAIRSFVSSLPIREFKVI